MAWWSPKVYKQTIGMFRVNKINYYNSIVEREREGEKEQEVLPDPCSAAHLLGPFPCLCSKNHRYLPPSEKLSIHMILSLWGFIRIHKLHKCKPSRFPASKALKLYQKYTQVWKWEKVDRVRTLTHQNKHTKIVPQCHHLVYLSLHIKISAPEHFHIRSEHWKYIKAARIQA